MFGKYFRGSKMIPGHRYVGTSTDRWLIGHGRGYVRIRRDQVPVFRPLFITGNDVGRTRGAEVFRRHSTGSCRVISTGYLLNDRGNGKRDTHQAGMFLPLPERTGLRGMFSRQDRVFHAGLLIRGRFRSIVFRRYLASGSGTSRRLREQPGINRGPRRLFKQRVFQQGDAGDCPALPGRNRGDRFTNHD